MMIFKNYKKIRRFIMIVFYGDFEGFDIYEDLLDDGFIISKDNINLWRCETIDEAYNYIKEEIKK
jgi:hypothetical protein